MSSNQSITTPSPPRDKAPTELERKESPVGKCGDCYIDVYVHQAIDIQNICIYHKQDVYAKLYLTADPQSVLSTSIINGGGRNPVFNQGLRLNLDACTMQSSLKCEIWMLSRVKNYLQDQLLGFAVVPLAHLFAAKGKLAQEFSLSSTDLFHSPAGFVQLSISYHGPQPDVLHPFPSTPALGANTNASVPDSDSILSDYNNLEFPDPNIANENEVMVSQYYGMEPQSSENLVKLENGIHLDSGEGPCVVDKVVDCSVNSIDLTKSDDTPASSVLTNLSHSPSVSVCSQSLCDTPGTSNSKDHELVLSPKEKDADFSKEESVSSVEVPCKKLELPFRVENIVPEKTLVQQDIVDMYLKGMQQFTESLAKMKLPMKIEKGNVDSGNANGSTEQKLQKPKPTGSRMYYGSGAFF